MANETGYNGQQDPGAGADDLSATAAIVRGIMAQIQTTKLVLVKKVYNDGGLAPVGFIDVQPMVNQIDGAGNQTPHGVIHNVPYLRMQGGTDAIILDPKVDDIGYAGFCTHDISAVKASRTISNPGSRRRFDYADAVYIGGVLNGVPEQYIRFSAEGIEMVSPTKITGRAPIIEFIASDRITMQATNSISQDAPSVTVDCTTFTVNASSSATIDAPTITLDGNMSTTGTTHLESTLTVDGAAGLGSSLSVGGGTTLAGVTSNGVNIGSTHKHGGVQTGGGFSGPPT